MYRSPLRSRLPRARGLGGRLWTALRIASQRGLVGAVALTLLTLSCVTTSAAQERGGDPALAGSDSVCVPHTTGADPELAALFAALVQTADVVVTGERVERLADGAEVTSVDVEFMQNGVLLLATEVTCTLSGCDETGCRRYGCLPFPEDKPTGCTACDCRGGKNCTGCKCQQAIKVSRPFEGE